MAAASSDVGYTFHARCGRRVKITNSSKTAERLHRLTEFNNAVVICSQPLEEGKLFEVKIDTKIATWSGSILVGATTKSPERFRFPSSISNLTSSSWVFNGESVWKDGKKISSSYGSCSLESLVEGSTVGLMKKSNCLHLYINGADQGVADGFLPPGPVYPIVDLYGRCTRVSIIQPSVEETLRSSSEDSCATSGPLLFHRRCGQLVQVKEDGRAAFRRNAEGEFNHGVVLTSRPLKDEELFEVEIVEMVDKWAGSIEIGVTTLRPSEIQFPSTVTNMQSGTWVMSGSGIMENGDTIQDNFGRSLDSLKSGERVGVMRNQDGSLIIYINGRPVGVAATDLPPRLYGIVDLYGQCAEVKITNVASDSSSTVDPTSANVATPLRFHALCGGNAQISEDRLTASRTHPYEEFTRSTTFTSRPLRPNELFQVTVEVVIDSWSGSLQFGVCKLAPEVLDFEDFEEISDLAETSWVLSGTEVYHSGIAVHSDYPLNLDVVAMEMVVGVMVTGDGELHFFLGDEDMGCAATDIPSGVYGVVDIYGQCAQVTIVERRENSQENNHRTSRRRHTLTPQHVLRSLPNEPLTFNPSDHAFHPRCGRNVELTNNCTVAKRIHSYKDGVTFSVRPLKEGATFEVELLKRTKNWQGLLRIGLTTCNPSSFSVIPQVSTQLPQETWIVNGCSVLANGNTVTENYGRSLDRLQTGNIVGVQRSREGAMHVFVNGCDLGPAVFGVPESVYAVVDLYGSAQCVKVVGEKMETPISESNSVVLEIADQEASSSADKVTFSTSHGPNIQLGPDRTSARRVKSYTKAVVLSSAPLPNDQLFQVQIKRLNTKWSGTIMIGVTSLTPSQACMADKASDLQGQSFVLCASNGISCLFVGGQKLQQFATDVDLLSLKEGDTIGVLCEPNNTMSFYINGQCVAQVTYKVPKLRYAVVDLYGQCCEVEIKPLTKESQESKPPLSSVNAALHDNEPTSPSLVKEKLQPWKKQDKVRDTPSLEMSSSLMKIRSRPGINLSASARHTKPNVSPARKCHYQDLCERFVKNLAIPEPYLAVEYNKCYCETCAAQRGDPPVKYQGNPGAQMKYAVPLGWVNCGLRVGAQAEVMNVFTKWHVAYHGTAVGNVRNILDCGELMFPGDYTIGSHQVTRPEAHFNETFKPEGFDVQQIFVSPSIKYCTNGEVYAKTHRYTDPVTKVKYFAKVAFKLRIEPESYKVSTQTVQAAGSQIDDHFSNSELEWSTKCRKAIILYGLMVKLESSE